MGFQGSLFVSVRNSKSFEHNHVKVLNFTIFNNLPDLINEQLQFTINKYYDFF